MNFLLDTTACIALISNRPEGVRLQADEAKVAGAKLLLSSVVLHELWYGVLKSPYRVSNARKLEQFLANDLPVVAFDEEDARVAAEVRSTLEARGRPIGPYDVLIAGQALRRHLTLVTANEREFSRVNGLRWKNWASSRH